MNRSQKSEGRMQKSGRSLMLGCCIAAVVALAQLGVAQTIPVMLYGGVQSEKCYALVEGVDGGFCLAGWTRSFGPGTPETSNVLVVKTDGLGNPLWSRISVGANYDEAYSMVRTKDSSYVLTGWTKSYGPSLPYKNIFVIKLDASGNYVWGRVYGGPYDDEAYSIIQTSDRGYALTGLTYSFGPAPYPNTLVLKLDSLGSLQWMRVYCIDEGYSIVQTPDLGYAVCGRTWQSLPPPPYGPFLLKLDPVGDVQWVTVDSSRYYSDCAYSVAVDIQGQILVAGRTLTWGTAPDSFNDMFVAKFDLAGTLLWDNTYGWPNGEEEALDDRSLVATADDGSAVCGLTTSVGPGIPAPNFLILKLYSNGVRQWCRSHPSFYWPGYDSDVALPMIERSGGGYAVAGFSNSWPLLGGGDDFMLSTFDSLGNRPVCAEPQEPMVLGTLWLGGRTLVYDAQPEHDTMYLVPDTVKYDSVCYDTIPQGIDEGLNRDSRTMKGRGMNLRAVGFGVEMNLSAGARVLVSLFSADGRQVTVLAHREFAAGAHVLGMPADLPCGIYLVRAEAGNRVASTKVVRF